MNTQAKIEAIQQAIEKANNLQSKMDDVAWSVPALSSLRIRHLMNNLGAISTRYLECGVHKGGLFCSTVRKNENIEAAFAIDNWASDEVSGEQAYPQFLENADKCLFYATAFAHAKSDTFDFVLPSPPTAFPNNIDLYLYDAAHDQESQRKAITHFLPAMADEFILCVDDFDWPDVAFGTGMGIGEAIKNKQIEVLYTHAFRGNDHDNDGFWNGFFVALLKKK